MNDAMQELKDDIGSDLVRIENKLRDKWGMHGVDSTSLFARDSSNDNMHIWLTNDQDVDLLLWRPGSELPNADNGWVLAVFQPSRRGDYQEPPYYELATYDHADRRWRSKTMPLRAGEVEVVKWSYLPQLPNIAPGGSY